MSKYDNPQRCPFDIEQAWFLRRRGASFTEIGKRLGGAYPIEHHTVKNWLSACPDPLAVIPVTNKVPPTPQSTQVVESEPPQPEVFEPLPAVPSEKPSLEMFNCTPETRSFVLVRDSSHAGLMTATKIPVIVAPYWHPALNAVVADAELILVVLSRRDAGCLREIKANPKLDLLFITSLVSSPIASLCRIASDPSQNAFDVGQDWWMASTKADSRGRRDRWSPPTGLTLAEWIQRFPPLPAADDIRAIRELTGTLPPKLPPDWSKMPKIEPVPPSLPLPLGKGGCPPCAVRHYDNMDDPGSALFAF